MPMFKSKKPKSDLNCLQDPAIRTARASAPSPSQHLSPHHKHIRSDKFTGSYEWNDLRRSPVETPQPVPKSTQAQVEAPGHASSGRVSPAEQREVPRIVVSPVPPAGQPPREKERAAKSPRSRRTHEHTQEKTAHQHDRGRPAMKTAPKPGRRDSVEKRTRADLYHANLMNPTTLVTRSNTDASSTSHQESFTSHQPVLDTPADAPTSSHTHNDPIISPEKPTSPARSPQPMTKAYRADLRAEKVAGVTLSKSRRVSIQRSIERDLYHAGLAAAGLSASDRGRMTEARVPNEARHRRSGAVDLTGRGAVTRGETGGEQLGLRMIRTMIDSPGASIPEGKSPTVAECALPALRDFSTPFLPDYAPPIIPEHAHPPLPDNSRSAIAHHSKPLNLLLPLPDDDLPTLPPSTPSSPAPVESPLSITPTHQDPHQAPVDHRTRKLVSQAASSSVSHVSVQDLDNVSVLAGCQDAGSVYLTPRLLRIPSALHTHLTHLSIDTANLDPAALSLYLTYLSSPTSTLAVPAPTDQTWQATYPLINAVILGNVIRDKAFMTAAMEQLRSVEGGRGCPDAEIIEHLFRERGGREDVPEALKEWAVGRCVEKRFEGLDVDGMPREFLAAVVRRLMGRDGQVGDCAEG